MPKWVTCFYDIYVGTCARLYLEKLLLHQILLVRWHSINSFEFKLLRYILNYADNKWFINSIKCWSNTLRIYYRHPITTVDEFSYWPFNLQFLRRTHYRIPPRRLPQCQPWHLDTADIQLSYLIWMIVSESKKFHTNFYSNLCNFKLNAAW